MEIKVLGTGCKSCKKLHENVLSSVEELKVDATVIYVTDYLEIAQSGLLRTPGLIIDGRIVSSGKVQSVEELKVLISENIK